MANLKDQLLEGLPEADPKVVNWPLMNGWIALLIAVIYVVIVYVGVAIMKRRSTKFELWLPRIIHNAILVALSFYMVCEFIRQTFLRDPNFKIVCNPVDRTEASLGLAAILWVFYVSKILEFGDTFIMILRKSFEQVSFLHVYHHATIFLIWWLNVRYSPSGDAYLAPVFNSFVHCFMYGYYLLSTFGWNVWWKKYLTQLQLLQFVVFVLEGVINLAFDCATNKTLIVINTLYAFSLFSLFASFYKRSYTKKETTPKERRPTPQQKPKKDQ